MPPNIDCFQIGNKTEMGKQVLDILNEYEFEMQPSQKYGEYLDFIRNK